MAIKTVNKQSFGLKEKDPNVHGENVYIIKGGNTIVEDKWVYFNDILIDIKQIVYDFLKNASRRIFNQVGGILYVLIVMDKDQKLEVIPSISFDKNVTGEIREFPDLSGKVPLLLIKLVQDGSTDLTSIKDINKDDIKEYRGYGNFTPIGAYGDTGPKGLTGVNGLDGYKGIQGATGAIGYKGVTGFLGVSIQGDTGIKGVDGYKKPWPSINRGVYPIADFVGTPLSGLSPLTVVFTDLSIGIIETWSWDFGDGNVSSSQNPTHIYTENGTYTVTLTVSNEFGDDQEIKLEYILVGVDTYIQDLADSEEDSWQDVSDDSVDTIQDTTIMPD